jgi:hypothetical protein
MYSEWDAQLSTLTDAYLAWKHGGVSSQQEGEDTHRFEVIVVGLSGMSIH